MRKIGKTVVLLLVGTAAVALLASGTFAQTVNNYIINATSVSTAAGWTAQQGWTGGKVSSGKSNIISRYNPGARGNAGPAPCASLGFECGQTGSGGGDTPGQTWFGTNKYNGIKLVDIRKLSYWTIVGAQGLTKKLCDNGDPLDPYRYNCRDAEGNPVTDTDHEVQLWRFASQPPQIQLHVYVNSGADQRLLVYRPWGLIGDTNPNLTRKWQEWDCLATSGQWMVSENEATATTWDDFVFAHPDAYISTATVYSTTPVWTEDQSPCEGRTSTTIAKGTMGTPFNIVMGARAQAMTAWPDNSAWWCESYWAVGAADLVTMEYDSDPGEGETLVTDVYDFDILNTLHYEGSTDTYVGKAPNPPRCLSNKAVYDQAVYKPVPRAIANPWWGGGTVVGARMSATQRFPYYGSSFISGVTGSTMGNLYVLYGIVQDYDGETFNVSDGYGVTVPCYCAGAPFIAGDTFLDNGQYVRMVGSLTGKNPYEWWYNNTHITHWDPDPLLRVESDLWPWRFDTIAANTTILAIP